MANNRWTNPDGSRMTCSRDGCDQPVKTIGLCSPHYHAEWRDRKFGADRGAYDACPVNGCDRTKLKTSTLCRRCNQFRWRYSLTADRVLEYFDPANRFCGNPGCGSTVDLHMDHDHNCCPPGSFTQSKLASCGNCVRGWLCASCNKSLGLMQEDPRRIEGLLHYVSEPRR